MHRMATLSLCLAACSTAPSGGGSSSAAGGSTGSRGSSGGSTGTRGSANGGPTAGASSGASGSSGAGGSSAGGSSSGGGWSFAATTSLASLSQNDSSACGAAASPCTGAWSQTHTVTYQSGATTQVDAFWDEAVAAGAQAPGSAYGHVSKVPISTLLPGRTVPVWVETQNWWRAGSGHVDNGEESTNAMQIANQVADMMSRGFAGQVVDWYGPGTTADLALPAIRSNAEASGSAFRFAVMIDKGYFDSCGNTVACLNSAIDHLVKNDTPSSAYLTDATGAPLIFFFINSYYPNQYPILSDSGINYQGTRFVMYEPNGFSGNDPPNTVGEYAWVNPQDGAGNTTTTGSAGSFPWETDFGFKDLDSFFAAAAQNPGSFAVSEAHKGFEDDLASWSGHRIIDQRCGESWLQTFAHQGSCGGSASYQGNLDFLNAGNRLDFVMVDTWDDYEEGSEIETGLDDCLTSLSVTLTGSTLAWSPTWGQDPMNAEVSGSEATLDHYAVYLAAQGGAEVMWLADVACSGGACGHTLDVSTFGIAGGPYVFYVQAVGKPSIVNTLGGPTAQSYP